MNKIKVSKISNKNLSKEFAKSEQAKLKALQPRKPKKKKQKKYIELSNINHENLNVDYKAFLKTKYWKRISKFIKKRDKYKCIKCGGSKLLHVHHKNYINHKSEHLHLNDLITLCNNCHKNIHGL